MSWPRVSLADISESIDYGHTASADTNAVGPKFLRITDIQDGRVDWSSVPRCICSESGASKYALQDGDIVFARTGATTGKSYLLSQIPEEAVFASYLIRVRPCQGNVDPGYLSQFFDTQDYWAQINRSSSGTAQGGVNASKLKMLSIPLPPLSEQRRIAAILDKADALRAKRRETTIKLDQLLQSVFLEMFGDPMTNAKKWPEKPLSEAVNQGTIVTYGIVQAGEEFSGGTPYIRTGDITDGEIVEVGLRRTDPLIANRFSRSRVDTGDIVMSIRATVGTTALVPKSLHGANLTQGTARIAVGEKVARNFALHHLRSAGTQRWIERQVKGATFREITLGRLRELPMMIPPRNLQDNFDLICQHISKNILASQSSSAALEKLFTSLQQRAFDGKL